MQKTSAYIALGSNLHDPLQQITQAVTHLATIPATELLQVSSYYQSVALQLPEDNSKQDDYINAVAKIMTSLTPEQLLYHLHMIEKKQGRVRLSKKKIWAARTLDLDILLYGNECINSTNLQIPHGQLAVRNFVLYPLAELTGDNFILPYWGSIKKLLQHVNQDGLKKL